MNSVASNTTIQTLNANIQNIQKVTRLIIVGRLLCGLTMAQKTTRNLRTNIVEKDVTCGKMTQDELRRKCEDEADELVTKLCYEMDFAADKRIITETLLNKEMEIERVKDEIEALKSRLAKCKEILNWMFTRPYQVISGVGDEAVGEMHMMHNIYQTHKQTLREVEGNDEEP